MGIWKKNRQKIIMTDIFKSPFLWRVIVLSYFDYKRYLYYGSNILKLYIVLHYETKINRNGIQMVHVGFL